MKFRVQEIHLPIVSIYKNTIITFLSIM